MMFHLAPNVTLTFRGIELVNHYDTVGPTFRPLRLSIGATAVFENCVQRRRAGLPYKAAVVNMVEATRPVGVAGPQVCVVISNFTFRSTRSRSPVFYPGAINMSDYSTTVTPDSSLAYQNLFYGGYTYTTVASYYVVDNIVSDECLAQRPGTECVTLLLQQLDGGSTAAVSPAAQAGLGGGAAAADQSEDDKRRRQVIIGVVVPASVVLVVAAIAALLLQRRRRRRRLLRQRLESDQPTGRMGSSDAQLAGGGGGSGGKGRMPYSLAGPGFHPHHDRGCVFLGLEENQQLPEWSPLAVDVMEEEDGEDELQGRKRPETAGVSQITGTTDALPSPLGGGGGGGSLQQPPSDGASYAAGSGLLRPAISSHALNAAGAAAGAAGAGKNRPADDSAGAAAPAPAAAAAAAAAGPASDPAASSDRGGGGGGGSDMQAELGRMAQELRESVKDQAIKLEGVIGCGSFGTVYKGTWQGLPVAVKTLVFSASDDNRRRALQEAALCASISHANVVATYSSELQPLGTLGVAPRSNTSLGAAGPGGGGPDSGGGNSGERDLSQILEWRLYIVQEYADGGPLRKLYGNKHLWPSPGVVNMPAVVGLALGIARALSHLHAKRIIHGDLNPNNVLLKRDDSEPAGYIVKVGDFGLSVMLPQNRTHLSNLRMGTMFYMCPAVVMKGQVGPPSDVFSLGVMLWELYHGRRAGIRTDQGPRYSSIFPAFPPTCPDAYRAVALHCLQRQPQNRPSAALVELQLERLLEELTPAAAAVAAAAPPPASPGGGGGSAAAAPGAGAGARAGSLSFGAEDELSGTMMSGSQTLPPTQFTEGM
ncbi:hypothetical protein PLESTF_000110100 [Pleodorina starrii]|nr:hypothetical protein PLESTF_000110100 [Pleodorina starrii]